MTAFRVRTALPADRDGAIDLIRELNVFEAAITGDRLTDRAAAEDYYGELGQRLARSQGRLLVAEAEGRLVGLLGFAIDEDPAYVAPEVRRHGTVTDLVVGEDWRGRGVGRALLAEAERLTRAEGLTRLAIGVLDGNGEAARTYRAFGFRPYVQLMVKPLD